jgi:hypothetical protein
VKWPDGFPLRRRPRSDGRRRLKRRWKILLALLAVVMIAVLVPILFIETRCSAPVPGLAPSAPYRSLLPDEQGRRPEARTWLTYPEWYIVYSADTFGRFLEREPPSRFAYLRQIKGFWSGLCAVNRASEGSAEAADAKQMHYTIGLSFSGEMLIKAAWENSVGRLFEWLGGWPSENDFHSARVQRSYGAFMHETPWYAFPFGQALGGLWTTSEPDRHLRHWERRLALSLEYGGKAGYAAVIGWLSGAALGRDEPTLRFVARADPAALRAIDDRLRPVGTIGDGLYVVEAPRYAQFTELMLKLSHTQAELVEIAGNDHIFVTLLMPVEARLPAEARPLMKVPLDDRAGWERIGVTIEVGGLLPLLRAVEAGFGEVEHVYDY